LRARGATEIEREADVRASIEDGNGHILSATSPNLTWRAYIHGEDRVGVKYARTIVDECAEAGTHAIVISLEGPTPFTRRECEGGHVQFFMARDMCVTIVDHCLVPKHERITAEQLPSGVRPENLPTMEQSDRVVQYYNWPPRSIVRITRVFGGNEPIPYYRLVTPCTG